MMNLSKWLFPSEGVCKAPLVTQAGIFTVIYKSSKILSTVQSSLLTILPAYNISDSTNAMDSSATESLGRKLLRDGTESNFEIHVKGVVFRVQTHPLATHSAYFDRLFRTQNTIEMKERQLVLDDIPACLVARLILYCYEPTKQIADYVAPADFNHDVQSWTDEYAKKDNDTFDSVQKAHMLVQMFHLGDRFMMNELMQTVKEAFPRTVLEIFGQPKARDHDLTIDYMPLAASDSNTRDQATGADLETTCQLLRAVYTLSPPSDCSLRDVMLDTVHTHKRSLGPNLVFQQCYRELLLELPDISAELALSAVSIVTYRCCKCTHLQYVLLKPCDCASRDLKCGEEACINQRKAMNWCRGCFQWGTIDMGKIRNNRHDPLLFLESDTE